MTEAEQIRALRAGEAALRRQRLDMERARLQHACPGCGGDMARAEFPRLPLTRYRCEPCQFERRVGVRG